MSPDGRFVTCAVEGASIHADPHRRWRADRVAHRRGGRQRELAAEPVSHSPGRSPWLGPARRERVLWFTVRLGRAQPEADELTVVPANEAAWDDLQTVFGNRGDAPLCQCQRYKLRPPRRSPSSPPRRGLGACWPRHISAIPVPMRLPASSRTSMVSPSAGAPSSRARPIRGCCASTASRGRVARRTRPTRASGP